MAKQKPITLRTATLVQIKGLKPHPENYRIHSPEQLEHLKQAIRNSGFYRNVVISKDSFILAGHGIVEAATDLNMPKVTAVRMPFKHDTVAARTILAGDNYASYMAEDNDRMLTDLLKNISEDGSLLGTGFDEQSLAALAMVTRPASEIADFDAAAEWIGMPEFEHEPETIELRIAFDTIEKRTEFVDELGADDSHIRRGKRVWSIHWPFRVQDDVASIEFVT